MDDYSDTHTETFTLLFQECDNTGLAIVTPLVNQEYQVYAASKSWTFDDYSQTPACGYDFTYTAEIYTGTGTNDPLPSFISIDSATKTFSVQSNLPADSKVYDVVLTATINDTPLSSDSTQRFLLDVKLDCPGD